MKLKFLLFLLLIGSPLLSVLYGLEGVISSSHESGFYSDDFELSLSTISGIDLYYHFDESMDKTDVKYIFPLSLTAMSGELREYNIVLSALEGNEILETKTIKYIIDKDIPAPPVLDKNDGLYNNSISMEFKKNEDDIYYSVKSSGNNNFTLWDGKAIDIPQADSLITEIINSYCEDSAGNRSSVQVNSFTIIPAIKKHLLLEVKSPVEGVFLNNQLIYIDTSGYKWIRYSFDDVDPVSRGTSYINPVILKKRGKYKLNIAAMPLKSEEVLTKKIVFSIIDNQNIILNRNSGIYTEDISLKFNKNSMNYNLEDRAVVAWDTSLPGTLNFRTVPGVVKYISLRISNPAVEGEFRYFFILDKRIPAAPLISVAAKSPISKDTEVRILGIQGADLYYTTNGSTPDRYSAYYKHPFVMEIPEGRNSGSLLVKARAYFNDKTTSIVTSKLLTYDVTKPEKPELAITSSLQNKISFSISNPFSNRIIYTITYDGSEPDDPVAESFTGKENMILIIPHGIVADVRLKAALIDNAGNISDSEMIELVKIDTVPPKEPKIIVKDQKVTLIGSNPIYYKINYNNMDPDDYKLYESPLFLDTNDSNFVKYIISCFTLDEYGNKSNTVISKDIKIDTRTPFLPDYSGISDGGLYNNPRSLRFHSSDDIEIYYTVSSDSIPPEDPIPGNSDKIDEYLYFDCPVNETRHYTVKLVATYNNFKTVSLPELVLFEIDRIAPRTPVITSVINGTVYNTDVMIRSNNEEDKVWILIKDQIKTEDLDFENFENNGILLNNYNDYLIKQKDNSEKNYQLAALSIDNAGNTNISREIVHFSIDKIPPEPPKIKVDDSSSEFTIVRMTSTNLDDIIYEITFDGSYPQKPVETSINYQLPLEIQNKNINSIYINARTMDKAGNLSVSSTLRKITFSTLNLESPVINIDKLNSTENIISFSSLTGMKIYLKEGNGSFIEYIDPMIIDLRNRDYVDLFYYSEDSLQNKSSVAVSRIEKTSSSGNLITGISDNKIYNTGRVVWKSNESRVVRYEIALGNDLPEKVTVFSPELTDPIVFDSAEGETLRVTMNVKEFVENIPVKEQSNTKFSFTIDKSNPDLPTVQGVSYNSFYQSNRLIELNSRELVYYKISEGIDNLNSVNYKLYNKPIEVNVEEGKYKHFKLEIYSKDSAGNLSEVKSMEFTIDKANIYVSSKGRDSNDGTRFQPFRTIDRALEYISQTERKVINLTEGEFILESILKLKNDISINGGFSLDEWHESSGQTIINISGRLPENSPMLNIYSGNISLNNISLSNINLNAAMINMTGGTLLLDKVKIFHANGRASVSIEIKNAELTLRNTELIYGPVLNGNLINVKKSNIFLEDSIIKGTGNSGMLKILSLEKAKAVITGSVIIPFSGKKIEIINSADSNLDIKDTSFDTGSASIYSNLFVLKDSNLNMKNTEIGSENKSRIFSGFVLEDSRVEIDDCSFNLKADSGLSFVQMNNSGFELSNTKISADSTAEFLYLIKGNTSIVNLEKNDISIKTSDIFTGFELNNSVSVFENNRMEFGGGTTAFNSFSFQKPLNIEFTSNILISSNISWISSENQAAINIDGVKDSVVINKNNIYGWTSVLRHNNRLLRSVEELNNYRGFMDIPEDNYSRPDD